MMFQSVRLPQDVTGRLFLHSMPGRRESWDNFVSEAERRGIDFIVCLTSNDEIKEKSPSYADAISNNLLTSKIESFPITDYGVPADKDAFAKFVGRIADLLRSGNTVLAHCGAGIGRTGTFAICLLIELGADRRLAEKAINDAKAHPETPEQKNLVNWCEKRSLTKQHDT